MKYMGKEVKDIVVTLPFADGSEMDCGVYASFELFGKNYFVLLPLLDEKTLDYSQNFMLYQVENDEEGNPVVLYIEDDNEYERAARYFTDFVLPSKGN